MTVIRNQRAWFFQTSTTDLKGRKREAGRFDSQRIEAGHAKAKILYTETREKHYGKVTSEQKQFFYSQYKLDDVMSYIVHAHYLQGGQGTQHFILINAV